MSVPDDLAHRISQLNLDLLGTVPQGWQLLLVSRRGRTSRIRAREWTKLCVSTEEWEK